MAGKAAPPQFADEAARLPQHVVHRPTLLVHLLHVILGLPWQRLSTVRFEWPIILCEAKMSSPFLDVCRAKLRRKAVRLTAPRLHP